MSLWMQLDIVEKQGQYTVGEIFVDGKSLNLADYPEAASPAYVPSLCVADSTGMQTNCNVINCNLRDTMMKNPKFAALMASTGSHICHIVRT
jgi:hypothetical protein